MSVPSNLVKRVAVVGGGPSGLVMARALRRAGIEVVIYEKHEDVGGIWDPDNEGSPMYESAHFISSKYASGFYGYPMPKHFPDYPNWRLIRDYIRSFAREFDLYPLVRLNTAVVHAGRTIDGQWTVRDATGAEETYTHLVAANGVTWHPRWPTYPGLDVFTGEVRHSSAFRHPSEFAGKRVLIVGGGNSGVDIACDAARNADAAFWSVRRGYRVVPKYLFGAPIDQFASGSKLPDGLSLPIDVASLDLSALIDVMVGDLTRFGLPAPDHDAFTSHPILNDAIVHHMGHGDISGKPDVASFDGDGVTFVDGSRERIDTVLFATGYDYRIPFIDESEFSWTRGHPDLYLNMFHRDIDNLYVLGFIEFADAAYKRLDEMAQLIALDVGAEDDDKRALQDLKRGDKPDLRGGIDYIDSDRHVSYVESGTFQAVLADLRDRFDLESITDSTYRVAEDEERSGHGFHAVA